MRRNVLSLIAVAALFFTFVGHSYAANLDFNPDSVSTSPDSTFSADVIIDAGSDQVAGTDVYINFDPQYLELQTVTYGSYFPKVDDIPSSGQVYISGVIENQGEYQTGQGTVATITFKAVKAGSTTVAFDCNTANTQTSKIVQNDINATNIINCGGNGNLVVDISGDGSGSSSSGSSSGSSSSSSSSGGTLPKSGVYENVMKFAIPGMILLALGAVLKVVAR